MAQEIIPFFSHADFFIFDKPHDVSFHSEKGIGFFATLQQQFPAETLYPVHRLDKITSGLTIIARNKRATQLFGRLFETRAIQKTYIALSDKKPAKKQGKITGDMIRGRNGNWRLARSKQDPAITFFTSIAITENLRLFILNPLTGRTHQLRVMMKSLGSPILGDTRYGGSVADRGYLHAVALHFIWDEKERISCLLLPTKGLMFNSLPTDVFHQLQESAKSGC